MVLKQVNMRIDESVIKRFTDLVGYGNISSKTAELLLSYCDQYEPEVQRKRALENYIKRELIPRIKKYSGKRDPYSLINDSMFWKFLKENEVNLPENDVRSCIERLSLEYDNDR